MLDETNPNQDAVCNSAKPKAIRSFSFEQKKRQLVDRAGQIGVTLACRDLGVSLAAGHHWMRAWREKA